MSPSSTADDTGGYGTFGADGLTLPVGQQLAQCTDLREPRPRSPRTRRSSRWVCCRSRPTPTSSTLRTLYPGVYSHDGGFYDAVNPTTGAVGHRRLVLDQSMIMAALDNALDGNALQRHFAADPVSWAAHTYLSMETMSMS